MGVVEDKGQERPTNNVNNNHQRKKLTPSGKFAVRIGVPQPKDKRRNRESYDYAKYEMYTRDTNCGIYAAKEDHRLITVEENERKSAKALFTTLRLLS